MQTFFQHIRFSNGAALTIAVSHTGQDTATAGFAWCSPTDNFCRAKGRLLAEGRMKSKKYAWGFPIEDGRQNSLLKAARDYLLCQEAAYYRVWPQRDWADEAYEEFTSMNG